MIALCTQLLFCFAHARAPALTRVSACLLCYALLCFVSDFACFWADFLESLEPEPFVWPDRFRAPPSFVASFVASPTSGYAFRDQALVEGRLPWTIQDSFRHSLVESLAGTPFSLDPIQDARLADAFLVDAARGPRTPFDWVAFRAEQDRIRAREEAAATLAIVAAIPARDA